MAYIFDEKESAAFVDLSLVKSLEFEEMPDSDAEKRTRAMTAEQLKAVLSPHPFLPAPIVGPRPGRHGGAHQGKGPPELILDVDALLSWLKQCNDWRAPALSG
jgi:hypothetical protein